MKDFDAWIPHTVLRGNIYVTHTSYIDDVIYVVCSRRTWQGVDSAIFKIPSNEWISQGGFFQYELKLCEDMILEDIEEIKKYASMPRAEYEGHRHEMFMRMTEACTEMIINSIDTMVFLANSDIYEYSMKDVEGFIRDIDNALRFLKQKFILEQGKQVSLFELPELHKNEKMHPVVCIETGKKYESIAEAARDTGVNAGNISQAVRGELQGAGGYHWTEYIGDENYSIPKPRNRKYQKAVQCVETGKKYQSIKEAAEATNIRNTDISAAINGHRKTAGGYRWIVISDDE